MSVALGSAICAHCGREFTRRRNGGMTYCGGSCRSKAVALRLHPLHDISDEQIEARYQAARQRQRWERLAAQREIA
jgi:hypothetical protein